MIQDNVQATDHNEVFRSKNIRNEGFCSEKITENATYGQAVLRIAWQGGIAPARNSCITIRIDGVEEYVLNYNASLDIRITTGVHTFSFSYGKYSSLNGTISITGNSEFRLSIHKYGLILVDKMLQVEPNGFVFPSFQLYKENEHLAKGRLIGVISLGLHVIGRILAFLGVILLDSFIGNAIGGCVLLLTIFLTLILGIIGSVYYFIGNKEVNTKHDSNFPRKNVKAVFYPFITIGLDFYLIIKIIANM